MLYIPKLYRQRCRDNVELYRCELIRTVMRLFPVKKIRKAVY